MKTHSDAVRHSSRFCDWGTPPEMFDVLHRHFRFVLDVCATKENTKCPMWFGLDQGIDSFRDGLANDWRYVASTDRIPGAAFMNPPYSRELKIRIEPWIEKAYLESTKGLTVVGVIPASTQTLWWKEFVRKAHEIWFLTHRVNFVASPPMLDQINADRIAKNKKPVEKAWNAGGNTAIVVWRPDPGFVGTVEPAMRYWTYRTAV